MKKKEDEVKKQVSTNADTNIYMVLGSRFEVERYEIIDPVGSGAYGVVVAAKDLEAEDQENNLVAIKKIEKAFEHKVFAQRTLRELKIMRLLQHDNVIGVKTILKPVSRKEFKEIYSCLKWSSWRLIGDKLLRAIRLFLTTIFNSSYTSY